MPCCCPNFCCPCMPMMWASAMSQIKGKNYSYPVCCLLAQCGCLCCTEAYMYGELGKHYGIDEKMGWCKCCLPLLSFYQILDTVMVKEGLHMTMAGVAPDAGAPPEGVEMER